MGSAPRNLAKEATGATRPDLALTTPRDTSGGSAERTVRSDVLLQGRRQVLIMHNGETYQLRATRLGKLILTK